MNLNLNLKRLVETTNCFDRKINHKITKMTTNKGGSRRPEKSSKGGIFPLLIFCIHGFHALDFFMLICNEIAQKW